MGGVEANADKGPAFGPARGVSDVNLAPAWQSAEGDPWAVVAGAGGPAWPRVSAPYKGCKSPPPGQCGRGQEVVPRPSWPTRRLPAPLQDTLAGNWMCVGWGAGGAVNPGF